MKKLIILCFHILLMVSAKAQNVNNHSFDSIYLGGIDRIFEWITSDVWPAGPTGTVMPLNPNDHYVGTGLQYHETYHTVQIEYAGAYDGPYAIKVLSDSALKQNDGSYFDGFITNGNHFYTDSAGYIDFKKGGTPFAFRPSKLRGHFKFESQSPSLSSFGKAVVLLKKYNSTLNQSDTIGFAETTTHLFTATTWTPFELPINYYSSLIPDSIVVIFSATNYGFNATLWVDSIGFDYSSSSAIDDLNAGKEKLFYQNTLDGKVYFTERGAHLAIQLYEVNGRLVMQSPVAGNSLDCSTLNKGVYFLVFNDKNNTRKGFKLIW